MIGNIHLPLQMLQYDKRRGHRKGRAAPPRLETLVPRQVEIKHWMTHTRGMEDVLDLYQSL